MPGSPRRFYLIKQLERASYQQLDEALRGCGLTPAQYMALSLSGHRGDVLSSAELARRARTSAQAMNEVIAALEAKDLIVRHEDADRRRILRISLTPKGRQVLSDCEKNVDAIENDFFGMLTPGEDMLFRELLTKIIRGLSRHSDADNLSAGPEHDAAGDRHAPRKETVAAKGARD